MGKPEEVASAIVFLSSEAASYITGVNFYDRWRVDRYLKFKNYLFLILVIFEKCIKLL